MTDRHIDILIKNNCRTSLLTSQFRNDKFAILLPNLWALNSGGTSLFRVLVSDFIRAGAQLFFSYCSLTLCNVRVRYVIVSSVWLKSLIGCSLTLKSEENEKKRKIENLFCDFNLCAHTVYKFCNVVSNSNELTSRFCS